MVSCPRGPGTRCSEGVTLKSSRSLSPERWKYPRPMVPRCRPTAAPGPVSAAARPAGLLEAADRVSDVIECLIGLLRRIRRDISIRCCWTSRRCCGAGSVETRRRSELGLACAHHFSCKPQPLVSRNAPSSRRRARWHRKRRDPRPSAERNERDLALRLYPIGCMAGRPSSATSALRARSSTAPSPSLAARSFCALAARPQPDADRR